MSNHLLRSHAPIPDGAWDVIDDEARSRLTPLLAARRLVDFTGPDGWGQDRLTVGRTTDLGAPPAGVAATTARLRQRKVQPYAEVRVAFTVDRGELEDITRGARDEDLDDLDRAVREAAAIETRAVVHGWAAAGITGLAEYSSLPTAVLGDDTIRYPTVVAAAVDTMRNRGVEGPYALALSPERFTHVIQSAEHGGYLLLDHLQRVLGGPVVWAPGVEGGVLVSQRGEDFWLAVGQDWSVGYTSHDADVVELYLEETFTFWPGEDDAVIAFS